MNPIKKDTQLVNIKKYNPKKSIIFSKPVTKKVQENKNIKYKIVNITTKNEDGTKGDLVLEISKLFTFGKENGYTLPLCWWNKEGPTSGEMKFTKKIQKIVDCCIDHIIESNDFVQPEWCYLEKEEEWIHYIIKNVPKKWKKIKPVQFYMLN